MKKVLERFVADHAKMVIIVGTVAILALAFLSGLAIRGSREDDRLALLRTGTDRRALELLSQTLDSSFMGGLSLLGLIDPSVKEDALGKAGSRPAAQDAKPSKSAPNGPAMTRLLGTTAKAYGAQGVFIVDAKGVVGSSWDDSGKPSTGLDVSFRPYFLMGMRGSQNIYAAVSLARGDRAIYYAAPVRQGDALDDPAIGVIVGRSSLAEVDRLIRGRADRALLISPQGVVFAASDTAFVGKLAAEPTPDRLAAIKALRQFGKSFESGQPEALPFICDDGIWLQDGIRWAAASTQMDWNDPSGPWKLVFMEDLSKSVPLASWLGASGGLALAFLLLGWLMFAMVVGNHRQTLSTGRMESLAGEQETRAGRKAALAAAMLRLQKKASAAELAAAYLTEAHGLIGSIQGVVYARDEERGGQLRLVADYACAEPSPSEIAPGEGLLGQCATEGRTIVVRSPDIVPAAKHGVFAAMRSGLGGTSPAVFVISPFFLG
ncbi:MAG: C4-dicarboxylate transporter, partial [Spirochaetota bacterium]